MKNRPCFLARTLIGLALTAIQTFAQSVYTPYTFTTLAGTAAYGSVDGTGSDARFFQPYSVATDGAGNVYVADTGNSTIRKMTSDGVVTTLAGLAGVPGDTDGTGSNARFRSPSGMAVDSAGNIYVADNETIRKVTPAGVVTTLAGWLGGGGYAGLAVDNAGNVYLADTGSSTTGK